MIVRVKLLQKNYFHHLSDILVKNTERFTIKLNFIQQFLTDIKGQKVFKVSTARKKMFLCKKNNLGDSFELFFVDTLKYILKNKTIFIYFRYKNLDSYILDK